MGNVSFLIEMSRLEQDWVPTMSFEHAMVKFGDLSVRVLGKQVQSDSALTVFKGTTNPSVCSDFRRKGIQERHGLARPD